VTDKPIIFNVISGKGGTGKTLLTAVLADTLGKTGSNVLVIDLDIFVRGLTTMFYYQNDQRDMLINEGELSTSDMFLNRKNIRKENISIRIYKDQSFKIVPAVKEISQTYKFHDIMPNTIGEALDIIGCILDNVQRADTTLDYIFLDSRAGYDEVVAAAYLLSTYSICVDEDDSISMVTANNLLKQFDSLNNNETKELLRARGRSVDLDLRHVYRIRNKTRNYDNTNTDLGISMGVDFLGFIPFDGDIMRNFGSKQFWNEITKTLYMEGVCNAWDTLARKRDLPVLNYSYPSSTGSKRVEKILSALPTLSRMGYLYGFFLLFFGAFLMFTQSELWAAIFKGDPYIIMGLIVAIWGIFLLITSVVNLASLKKTESKTSNTSSNTNNNA
jgi:septum site-determining protein MinD